MAERGAGARVGAADVELLRARLRSSQPAQRAGAVAALRSWQGAFLGPAAAESVLRAASVGYPWCDGVNDDVGELLVQLLWRDPHALPAAALERAYALCAEGARRALLRTLALRADDEAVDVVGHLLGLDGPWDLLPAPIPGLLSPLATVPTVRRLVPALVGVAWRRGWAEHVGELLTEIDRRGGLDPATSVVVCDGLALLVGGLVDTCDRGVTMGDRGNLARVDRRRLRALLPVFATLDCNGATRVLHRVLSSADPRVAALAVVALARRGELVASERVDLIARDPEARGVLIDGLAAVGRRFELPAAHRGEVAMAESALVAWLASADQLGSSPDELEHRGAVLCPPTWGRGVLHLFAFRVRPPHWSAARGWMLAAVGPFDPSAELEPRRRPGFAAHSLYESEDGDDADGHVVAIADAVIEQREERAGQGDAGQ